MRVGWVYKTVPVLHRNAGSIFTSTTLQDRETILSDFTSSANTFKMKFTQVILSLAAVAGLAAAAPAPAPVPAPVPGE